jgi:hypothetical protein
MKVGQDSKFLGCTQVIWTHKKLLVAFSEMPHFEMKLPKKTMVWHPVFLIPELLAAPFHNALKYCPRRQVVIIGRFHAELLKARQGFHGYPIGGPIFDLVCGAGQ